MFLEVADEDDDEQPCQACGEDDNEDVLMYCDGCQKLWHTYCAGLQEVPHGHWFCDNCRAQRVVDPRPQTTRSQASRRRTRGQQRRQRSIQHVHEQSWNDVWQSVYSRINLDLDFPYDEDDDTSVAHFRRHRQRSIQNNRVAHEAFLRRMRVAEMHGAGNRFRETEPTLPINATSRLPTHRSRRRSPTPPAQDPEEVAAWDAFDQARAASAEPSSSRPKKRKSRTSSPADSPKESTPAVVKRRRTSQSAAPRPNSSRSSSARAGRSSRPSPAPRRAPESTGPSFLQSLLQEVEHSSTNPNPTLGLHRPSPRNAGSPAAEQTSPRPSSPAQSPLPSNHSSPRAMSASPTLRPSSPTGLSSSIQPIFPLAPTEFSPLRPNSPPSKDAVNGDSPPSRPAPARSTSASSVLIAQPQPLNRPSRLLEPISPPAAPQIGESSPTRATLSYNAKSDVQKLVSAALKPHYTSQNISKDQYTVINRDISRMLYDRIGDFESLRGDDKAKWEQVAGDEVNKAVGALKAQG